MKLLTKQQRDRLDTAKDGVANAKSPDQKRKAANVFREECANVAEETEADEILVALMDPTNGELNTADCDGLIEQIEAASHTSTP